LPPSLELPAPVKDLRAARKGNRISLTWTVPTQTTDHENVRRYGATRICRSRDTVMNGCGKPVGTVAPAVIPEDKSTSAKTTTRTETASTQKTTASYTDTLAAEPGVGPADQATYGVEVLNQDGRGAGLSNPVHVSLFPAPPPPNDFRAQVTPEGIKVTWACPLDLPQLPDVRYRLRIFRSPEGSAGSSKVGEADLMNCREASLLDSSFVWENSYDYHASPATIVAVPSQPGIEIEGDDTPRVRVVAHDIFPPAVPAGLQAVFSGPGQQLFIDLVWSPDTDSDLAGYNTYRHEEGGLPAKINPELIKVPGYRDSAVQAGKKYFYSVSAVDVRGNESARSEEANEAVP
jgi:hypothetical protein